jgi:hypothetical protein
MMLKRALAKDNVKMTRIERDTLLELLDKLLNLVTNDRQMFTRTRRAVMESLDEETEEHYDIEIDEASGVVGIGAGALSKSNQKRRGNIPFGKGVGVDINQIPPIIMMKRRAIRVFPDGQKVALYWADRINKFISVPFQSIGIGEETIDEKAEAYGAKDVAANAASFVPGPVGMAASAYAAKRSYQRGNYGMAALGAVGALPIVGYVGRAAKAGIAAARGAKALLKTGKIKKVVPKSGTPKPGAVADKSKLRQQIKQKKKQKKIDRKKARRGGVARKLSTLGGGGNDIKSVGLNDKGHQAKTDSINPYTAYKTQKDAQKARSTKSATKENLTPSTIKKLAEQHDIELSAKNTKKIASVYKSLDEDNQQVFRGMINKDKESFSKLTNFALNN